MLSTLDLRLQAQLLMCVSHSFSVFDKVVQITFVAGETPDVSCPEGYIQNPINVNDGAGGKFIYTCFTYNSAFGEPIASVTAVLGIAARFNSKATYFIQVTMRTPLVPTDIRESIRT